MNTSGAQPCVPSEWSSLYRGDIGGAAMYFFIGTGFAAMGIAALLADHVVASFCAVLVCIGFYLDLCSIFRSLHTRKIVSPARVVLTNGVLAIHRDSWIRVLDSSARISFGVGALLFALASWRGIIPLFLANQGQQMIYTRWHLPSV